MRRGGRAISALTRENIERLAAGKPMKMRRGRLGIWLPGQPALPMQDIHPGRYRSEEVEGCTLMNLSVGKPWRDFLFHIPNGGGRSKREAALLKAQGVKSGVSDYFLAQPTMWHYGLWIELKASDGRCTDDQVEWLEKMMRKGYAACAAWGADAALEAINLYLSGKWIQS